MLNILRQKAGSWMVKAILGVIVIVFIFWGVGNHNAKKNNVVAVVDGEEITMTEYMEAYETLLNRVRKQFRNNLNDEMIKMLQLKQQTINMLIDRKLLINAAKKLKLRVTRDEVVSEIKKFPAFQTAGNFDNRLYSSILKRIRTTPEKFEAEQSVSLLLNKLRLLITDCVKVLEEEAREWFIRDNSSMKIDYVFFDPATYKGINPSDQEAADYFEIHKEEYKTEPEVKVRYLHFNPEKYKLKVKISNQELQDYYEANTDEFIEPETVEARHILLKAGRDATPEMLEAQKNKALEILEMAKKGDDFSELAKQYSEGPSKKNGGFLGAFRKKDMVKPFANKAFSMKPGEISDPVQTRFGWHIIKVEKVTPELITSFEKAKIKILEKMTAERSLNLAYDEAESVYSASFGGDDLITAAQEHNMKVETTGFFTKQGPEKGISDRSKFASAAFVLPEMEISDIIDCQNTYYILQLVKKKPSIIKEFSVVREKIITALTKEKQKEKARLDAQALLDDLKNGVSIISGAEKYNLKLSASDFFKRNDLPNKTGLEETIITASFQLSQKHKLPENIIEGIRGYYVILFNENQKPGPDEFNDNKETITNKILEEKKNRTFETWLTELKSKSEISTDNNFLENE